MSMMKLEKNINYTKESKKIIIKRMRVKIKKIEHKQKLSIGGLN